MQFLNSIGKDVFLRFKKTFVGRKNLKGKLKEYSNGNLKIETEDEVFYVPLKSCSYVKLEEHLEKV